MLLLDPPEPLPATMDAAAVRAVVQASRQRLRPARHLMNRGEAVAGLVLYRDAGRLLVPHFRKLLEHRGRPVPSSIERREPLLFGTDSIAIDRLEADEVRSAAEDLDQALEAALERLDQPTESQRRVQWWLRFSALGTVVLLCVMAGVAWFRPPPNLARGKPVSASSVALGAVPERAIDGIRYGRLGFHSDGPGHEWWSVDLGRTYELERIAAYGRADCCFDQSVPLALETSLDGKSFREIANRTKIFRQSDPWVIPGAGITARFVRFRTLRATYLVLAEVEVNGRPVTTRSDADRVTRRF
jgi:hypothetical protein